MKMGYIFTVVKDKIYWIFLFSFFLFLSCSDENNEDEDNMNNVIASFQKKYEAAIEKDIFAYFTDPHLLNGENRFSDNDRSELIKAIKPMQEIYNHLPQGFCLCGGDWLNQGDTQEVAKQKLLYADSQMKNMFSRYYKMMGNHDTNYQGVVSSDDSSRGDFSRDFIDKEYFQETGSAYYSFKTGKTKFFILDSGLDWSPEMDEYKWEQVFWLAEQLQTNDSEHNVLGIHMFYGVNEITPMSELLVALCDAYNYNHGITLQEVNYDYSKAKGKIHFILSGHSHKDSLSYEGKAGRLPVIQTCNYTVKGTKSFDLCLMNYDDNVLHMTRIGQGDSRTILFY